MTRCGVAALAALVLTTGVWAQSALTIETAMSQLGDFDYNVRTAASGFIRRLSPDDARPVLAQTVATHEDGYVRYRALVLLVGFGGSEARDTVLGIMEDENDRLRAVAYGYFTHEPDPAMVPRLLEALDAETSEFVRPALIRALASHDGNPRVRQRLLADIDRGVDFFRGAVIEALGERRAAYALEPLMAVASAPGPLQDDALLALTRIGDARALNAVAALQGADSELEPMVSAAAASFDENRAEHFAFVSETLAFAVTAGDQRDLVRSAAAGLGALASAGDETALSTLIDVAVGAPSAEREALALVVGMLAMRTPEAMLAHLETRADLADAVLVVRDGFDMLDEDLEEERFFMTARSTYWGAPEGSTARYVSDELIRVLEF